MKVAVTGAEGFIGSNLVKYLERHGHTVVPVDIFPNRLGISIPVNILDTEALYWVIRGCDAVVHLAAKPGVGFSIEHPEVTHLNNVTGTRSVIAACEAANIPKMLYASSSSVYGNQTGILNECLPVRPTSPYAATKATNERDAAKSSIPSTLGMRFFTVYGNNGRPDMAYSIFAKAISKDEEIEVTDLATTRDFTHVSTVVSSIASLLITNASGIVNVCQGQPVSLGCLIDSLRPLGVPKIRETALPHWSVPHTHGDNSKLSSLVDIKTVGFPTGMADYVKWFKRHSLLI